MRARRLDDPSYCAYARGIIELLGPPPPGVIDAIVIRTRLLPHIEACALCVVPQSAVAELQVLVEEKLSGEATRR